MERADGMRRDGVFSEFYEKILCNAVTKLESLLVGDVGKYAPGVLEDFKNHLEKQLEAICLRTLIVEMHRCKDAGELKGKDREEEYTYFCTNIVGTDEFREALKSRYPVLERCINEKAGQMTAFYTGVIHCFCQERAEIGNEILAGESISKITRIFGDFSDVHQNGKQVLKLEIDEKWYILFKPRKMENEKIYQEMLEWMEIHTGISQYRYSFLSYENHSWSSIVEYKACITEDQVKRYYQRLGVQLFLAYLLGTKDLHYENLIACGEFPVLIDLETLLHTQNHKKADTIKDEICFRLSESVLYTGLLPIYRWNQGGKGINASAIACVEGQRYPFQIPVVVNAGTSDMQIQYANPVFRKSKNLVNLNGYYQSPLHYEEDIVQGFMNGYEQVMENKSKFRRIIEKLEDTKSRFLVADTQRYSMLLSSSYHPSLLMNHTERQKFLYSMWKGRDDGEKEIVESEVRALLRGDIPYFIYNVSNRNLYASDGGYIEDYFSAPVIRNVYDKLALLCIADMEKQCEYIRLSLNLMPQNKENFENKVYYVEERNDEESQGKEEKAGKIQSFKERLLKYAVWNKSQTEVSWCVAAFSSRGNYSWNIRPMNFYLYEGLAGMLLLTHELGEEKLYQTLKNMLFRYTDRGRMNPKNLSTSKTGMYNGESSLLYAYLMLYSEKKEQEYLEYARKHAEIVGKMLKEDQFYDLINGNAGAAHVFLQLYRATGENKYLKMAEYSIEIIEKRAVNCQRGIGWITEEEMLPMAGMAHGNSGILMPVFSLWTMTGKRKYEQLAEQIWLYEDSLYDTELQNWRDMRVIGGESAADAVAWCHGAGGVLLSRINCRQKLDADNIKWKERLERDIARAYAKLKKWWKRDSWSLCHGNYGNLEILKKGAEVMGEDIEIKIKSTPCLLPQEEFNPGLLDGYGGILYAMECKENTKKLELLGLDLQFED